MGSPLSPVLANIFMKKFEEYILKNCILKPKVWLRYVDDIFVVWPHGLEELKIFENYINSLHQKIKFTMELENNCELAFLDILM